MSIQLPFVISMESNYHVGAGHGDGLVDSMLLRDRDGVPVIRGSVLAGLLRDAIWQLMKTGALQAEPRCQRSGLESGPLFCNPQGDPCPLCRILGSPGQPKRWRVGSARPEMGKGQGGLVVQRVRVNPRTRRAEPRKLFSQEQGEASWEFHFNVHTKANDQAAYQEAALLVAAARAIRGLGRARRRGLGVCRFHLKDRSVEADWLERFRTFWLEGKAMEVEAAAVELATAPDAPPTGHRRRLTLFARLEEPVLISRRAEAGNEFETAGSISGTALLGALASRVARRYDLTGNGAAKDAFVKLFLRERLRFSTLFPTRYWEETLIPTIPAPLDLLTCKAFPGFSQKTDEHAVTPFSLSDAPPRNCLECEQKFQDLDVPLVPLDGFVVLEMKPHRLKLERRHEMHISVDPETGRVNEGDLYGYVSLESGQYFLGEIDCADEADWRALKEMADLPELGQPFEVYFGRAGRRGHGRVTIVLQDAEKGSQRHPWRVLSLEERVQDLSQGLRMTLLSDAILPDRWLRSRTGLDEAWLGKRLGVPVAIQRAFVRSRRVDGFFGHLGLPRYRDWALVAGSTVGIIFPQGAPSDLHLKLAELEREGIGLRREEGYGQVVFNHPIYADHGVLDGHWLELPEKLRPQSAGPAQADVIADFARHWSKELKRIEPEGKTWKLANLDVVARLLRHGAGDDLPALKSRLIDEFGQPANLLGKKRAAGISQQEKKIVRETREAREEIGEWLDALSGQKEMKKHPNLAEQLQRLGVELLADRVAQGAAAARAAQSAATARPAEEKGGAE